MPDAARDAATLEVEAKQLLGVIPQLYRALNQIQAAIPRVHRDDQMTRQALIVGATACEELCRCESSPALNAESAFITSQKHFWKHPQRSPLLRRPSPPPRPHHRFIKALRTWLVALTDNYDPGSPYKWRKDVDDDESLEICYEDLCGCGPSSALGAAAVSVNGPGAASALSIAALSRQRRCRLCRQGRGGLAAGEQHRAVAAGHRLRPRPRRAYGDGLF